MSYQDHELSTVQDVVDVALEHQFWWFRGHPRDDYEEKLIPRVFRKELVKTLPETDGGHEAIFVANFKMRAPAVYAHCPEMDNLVEWLALMQHFRGPTRLLDWSANCLVAAYFAVEKHSRSTGELWSMDARKLTVLAREAYAKPWTIGKAVAKLSFQAVTDKRHLADKKCADDDCCAHPLPFSPPLGFARIANQQGWFTIHPRPEHPRGRRIEDLLSGDSLKRFVISAQNKHTIRDGLAALGITAQALFPDLECLGETLQSEYIRQFGR